MGILDLFLLVIFTYLMIHLLILVHELGHLIAALIVRAPVSEISTGVGKKLFSIKFENFYFNLRLIPVAGYVSLIRYNWTPLNQKAEFQSLRKINPTHPGLNRTNWLRKKHFFKRIFVMAAGPAASISLGVFLIVASVKIFGPIEAFHPMLAPRDARCAAAVVADLEIRELKLNSDQ